MMHLQTYYFTKLSITSFDGHPSASTKILKIITSFRFSCCSAWFTPSCRLLAWFRISHHIPQCRGCYFSGAFITQIDVHCLEYRLVILAGDIHLTVRPICKDIVILCTFFLADITVAICHRLFAHFLALFQNGIFFYFSWKEVPGDFLAWIVPYSYLKILE